MRQVAFSPVILVLIGTMRKDQVNPNKVGVAPNKAIPALIFSGTFDNHMLYGDKKGGPIPVST
jgi:hypothetical protein